MGFARAILLKNSVIGGNVQAVSKLKFSLDTNGVWISLGTCLNNGWSAECIPMLPLASEGRLPCLA